MRVAILTGGGDCPGLNSIIRGLVMAGIKLYDYEFIGFLDGWAGPIKNLTMPLDIETVRDKYDTGGTLLGTSRTNPMKDPSLITKIKENLKADSIDVLVTMGGDDTLGVATQLAEMGVQTIGVPKTIDNDLSATDYTFGFDTAVSIATEAIDRLHTTARSHHRALIVEVMGRHSGWIALDSGIAGGADYILLPERDTELDDLCASVKNEYGEGKKNYAIIVASEGAKFAQMSEIPLQDKSLDAFGHVKLGGIGKLVAEAIEHETGIETRYVRLGHTQRGGPPTARDRVLSTRYGIHAAAMIHRGEYGMMAALKGNEIVSVPLAAATDETKVVGEEWFPILEILKA
ncbi:MAG: ATP-dependent 6-phosphofructokinase [Candidatus Marinimicrobia bacterium]|nr:ATP-dependent 6-phosphofructokinase [Candidatus Neomarinimicrobiota bacterium]